MIMIHEKSTERSQEQGYIVDQFAASQVIAAPIDIGCNKIANEESSDSMMSSVIMELPIIEPMTKMLWKTLSYHQSRQFFRSDIVESEELAKVTEKSQSDYINQRTQDEDIQEMRRIIADLNHYVIEEELAVIEESNEILGKVQQVNTDDSIEQQKDKCLEEQSEYQELKCEVISLLQHRIHMS